MKTSRVLLIVVLLTLLSATVASGVAVGPPEPGDPPGSTVPTRWRTFTAGWTQAQRAARAPGPSRRPDRATPCTRSTTSWT